MKWIIVCDRELAIEDYGVVLAGVPSREEIAGCPEGWRAVYLEASVEQVKPLSQMEERVCRVRPVWEEQRLSPAELLVLGRRLEAERESEEQPKEDRPPSDGRQ